MTRRIVVRHLSGLRQIMWTEDEMLEQLKIGALAPEITMNGTDRFKLASTAKHYVVYQEVEIP